MTTSEEHLERLQASIPPPDEPWKPRPVTAEEYRALADKLHSYQSAVLMFAAGSVTMMKFFRDAIEYLEPKAVDAKPGFREDLISTIHDIERALHAQDPPRQAAE